MTNVDVTKSVNNNVITAQQTNAVYQWIDCATNQPISGETNISFAPSVNGDYAVIVTFDGCSDTSSCVIISTVSLSSLSMNTISPVPAEDEIIIQGDFKIGSLYEILSISGERISSGIIQSNSKISVMDLARGAYFIRIGESVLRFTKI
ncbi:T9SS type A sorting domain-containing protein [Crocinitomicaceae bacterium]|nr:T9SS type A sorting domain-containing protein [Crocinitomicaceae bacterium]